jgi:hypothetical protein
MTKKALILSGIKWDTTTQRHHAIAYKLKDMGYEVYFVEGIVSSSFNFAKVIEKLKLKLSFRRQPRVVIPKNEIIIIKSSFINPHKGLFMIYNKFVINKLLNHIPNGFDIVVNYLPINTTELIIANISYRRLFYDCVRDFENWGGYPKGTKTIEDSLILKSEAVLVDSYYLFAKLRSNYPDKTIVQILPMLKKGQNTILSKGKPPEKITEISYIGQIGAHIDVGILKILTERGYNVHHFGGSSLKLDCNINNHGFFSDPRSLASEIITHSDALIIPYSGNMDGVIPAKIFECLSSNLPVFISDFYDSRLLSEMVYVYSDTKDLLSKIQKYEKQVQLKKNHFTKEYLNKHSSDNEIHIFESLIISKDNG